MMKKLILMAISIAALAPAVFAGAEPGVNKSIANAFRQEFGDATSVTWKKVESENVYIGQFVKDGTRKEAFFDQNGKLIGEGEYISPASLPLTVQRMAAKEYSKYKLIAAYEFYKTDSSVPVYALSIRNNKEILQLRLNESNELSVVKRIRENFTSINK